MQTTLRKTEYNFLIKSDAKLKIHDGNKKLFLSWFCLALQDKAIKFMFGL